MGHVCAWPCRLVAGAARTVPEFRTTPVLAATEGSRHDEPADEQQRDPGRAAARPGEDRLFTPAFIALAAADLGYFIDAGILIRITGPAVSG
jgi:hypothetical protein